MYAIFLYLQKFLRENCSFEVVFGFEYATPYLAGKDLTTMKRILAILCTAAALCTLVSCGGNGRKAPAQLFSSPLDSIEVKYNPGLERGTAAPALEAPDTSGTMVSLAEMKGSYAVVDFWASWCRDCRAEAPTFHEMYDKYGKTVKFLSISMDDDAERWKTAIIDDGMEWTNVSQLVKWKDSEISKAWQVHWIPTFYVVDPDGNILAGCIYASRIGEVLEAVGAGK